PGPAPERRRHPARGLCGRSHAGNRREGDACRGVLFAQARAAPRDPWRALSDAVDADRRTRPRRDVGPLRTHGRSGRASAPHGPHCRHGPADVGSAARGDGAQRLGAGPAPRVREGRGVHVLSVRRAVRTPLAGAGMSTRKKTAERLTLVGASAGSGKTYRLTEEVAAAIAPGEGAIDLEGLVAVTYTKRAAADLGARIRRTLVEKGAHASAQRLPLAYLGTVHAVCLRLLQEFAIDAGLSPHVDVVPGSEARLLRQALEWGLAPAFRQRVQELADHLQIRWSPMTERTDWLTPVEDVMTLARSNRIDPGALHAMGERSAEGLMALLGKPSSDGDALDATLLAALESTSRALSKIDDGVDKTCKARAYVNESLHAAKKGALHWSDWVKLSKVEPGRAGRAAVAPLIAIASRVGEHPRLHEEVRAFTLSVFAAASAGLAAYDTWKQRRRVVDFVDMIDRALTLVEQKDVADELRERIRLLVIDEFQDTSPVQLALFVRLHALADRSTWVGDRKQCIFEFAGADPTLMEALAKWVDDEGGTIQQLPMNRRSRPELVDACSHLFAAAFARHGD